MERLQKSCIKVTLPKPVELEVPLVSSKADCSTRLNSCLGDAKVFKLEPKGAGLTLVNALKFEKMQFKLEDLGLKQEDTIDLTKMDWKEFK